MKEWCMRSVIASVEGATVETNLPASAPPVKLMLASNSVFFGKFLVWLIYTAERASLSE
jgi:hypothetical protein